MKRTLVHRFAPALLVAALVVFIATVVRVALALAAHDQIDRSPAALARIFATGLAYDLAIGACFAAALGLYLAAVPANGFARRRYRFGLVAWVLAATALLVFAGVAEWLFWDEFGTRFNFIAVDYLVYTREVLGNIRESYPVGKLLAGIAGVTALLVLVVRASLRDAATAPMRAPRRVAWATGLVALAGSGLVVLDSGLKDRIANRYAAELAGNGVWQFFAAARANELDYGRLYARREDDAVLADLHTLIATPGATFDSSELHSVAHRVESGRPERRLNVVLVSVESLSAEFLGAFGNRRGLTPNLDALAHEGLLLTRLYATGTRTVRGLEALSVGVPPTPGQSIVKRPGNDGLFTLATVFNAKGYESKFLYGGYGWFDNMSAFFGANGYQVVDRTALASADVHYENIWGVADEDLFSLALAEMDASAGSGRPFFLHVMTTSNHRPFTYPDGRIDVPSGSGRDGAVKYTDWAIGDFVERARKRPWFRDTLFVFVADHCAASAGKTDLPLERYHIPAIVYGPAHLAPRTVDRLASQIDLPPTILGLLDFSYDSRFFGYDLLKVESGRERAFISTYQTLGFLHDDDLVVLAPNRKLRVVHPLTGEPEDDDDAQASVEAIDWYQGASLAYRGGLLRLQPVASSTGAARVSN